MIVVFSETFIFQFGSEIQYPEQGVIAFFLWLVISFTVVGIFIVSGTLFLRNGIQRPFNQVTLKNYSVFAICF
jgi:hypothetical protein